MSPHALTTSHQLPPDPLVVPAGAVGPLAGPVQGGAGEETGEQGGQVEHLGAPHRPRALSPPGQGEEGASF